MTPVEIVAAAEDVDKLKEKTTTMMAKSQSGDKARANMDITTTATMAIIRHIGRAIMWRAVRSGSCRRYVPRSSILVSTVQHIVQGAGQIG